MFRIRIQRILFNRYLSDRDKNDFQDLWAMFGVGEMITYLTRKKTTH